MAKMKIIKLRYSYGGSSGSWIGAIWQEGGPSGDKLLAVYKSDTEDGVIADIKRDMAEKPWETPH